MSWFSSFVGNVTNFTATIIVAVAIHIPLLMHVLMSVPYVPPQPSNSLSTAATSIHVSAPVTKALYVRPPSVMSSSTTQVGQFTVVVNCADKDPNSIEVLKDGSTTQAIGIRTSDGGVGKCPSVESQDINFDGYPDFMILSDAGTGGGTLSYWLYSSSTQQFYCSEPYEDCILTQPTFYPSTKEILSIDDLGAGTVDAQIYGVANGKLVLLKEVQGSPTIIAPLEAETSSTGF